MGDRFYKMHGLGNDFVVVDAMKKPVAFTDSQRRQIADRRYGIGERLRGAEHGAGAFHFLAVGRLLERGDADGAQPFH